MANKAAALVSQVTRRVKIINTADFYENAPEKADITDYINAGGDLEKVIQFSRTAPLYKAVLSSNNSKNPIAPYYEKIDHYYINNDNCMVYQNGDNITPLCYGAIAINAEITKFNGLENEIFFDIIAATPGGDLLPRVTISAGEFNSLNWVVKSFGCNLALSPAQSAKQKLLTAITLSGLNCARSRVFTHTGYLFDNEKRPVNYLHAGGDLRNNSAIKTDIDNNLGRYVMSAPGSVDENKQAVNVSLSILGAHNPEITYPLLAFIYLSALTPVINAVCGDTGFLLYLQGKTQSGKSTLAALAASHFGKFNAVTPPASFSATANAINEISFILKDCLFWVDDYHPQGNNKDKKRIDSIFQTMARAAGDHATRARLNANSALKVNHPPRCLYLVTGEDEPNINQSGIARIFTINVNYCRKDITALTAAAVNGELSRANACYINYVIDNYDDVLSRFEQNYNEALKIAVNTFGACRLANQTALLITSLLLFLGFACDLGAITREQVNEIYKQGALYIEKAAHNIEKQITDIDPINQYMRAVSALLSSGRKRVINLLTDNYSYNLDDDIIGFSDDVFIYLDSNLAYKAVSDYLLSENNYFSISKTVIQKQLYEKGFVSGSENTPTIVKKINNKSIRVLRFNKEQLLTFGLSE